MKSMTGYAKVQSTLSQKKVNIEIKTLNSKQLDLIVKLPAAYRSHELEIRTLLGRLERGKVECTLSEENNQAAAADFNRDLLVSRFQALYEVADDLAAISLDSRPALFNMVAAMPDIWNTGTDEEVSDSDWALLAADIERAIDLTAATKARCWSATSTATWTSSSRCWPRYPPTKPSASTPPRSASAAGWTKLP